MARKYSSDFWELDALYLDSARYDELSKCISLVEHEIESFDDRNDTEHSSNFGTLIQTSFLMAVVAEMEHQLKKICDVVAEKRNWLIRTTDMRGTNGFDSCITYLKKVLQVPLPESNLKVIRAVVQVRNACVHHGGYLDEIPCDLGDAARHLGKSPDGQIEVTGPFVQDVCGHCQSFIDATVNAVGAQYAQLQKLTKSRSRR